MDGQFRKYRVFHLLHTLTHLIALATKSSISFPLTHFTALLEQSISSQMEGGIPAISVELDLVPADGIQERGNPQTSRELPSPIISQHEWPIMSMST